MQVMVCVLARDRTRASGVTVSATRLVS